MEKQYVLGLDNGGTVTKAALFDLEGHEICTAARNTPVVSPRPGYMERDMDELWQPIVAVFARCCSSPV